MIKKTIKKMIKSLFSNHLEDRIKYLESELLLSEHSSRKKDMIIQDLKTKQNNSLRLNEKLQNELLTSQKYLNRKNEAINKLKLKKIDMHNALVNIKKTKFKVLSSRVLEVRKQYDVVESVIFIEDGQLKEIHITSKYGVGPTIYNVDSTYDLQNFDQKDQIYYD